MRRPAAWWCGILLAGGAMAGLNSCSRHGAQSQANGKQLVILGIDGMDPGFLERHWDALPNLDRLRREGDFRRLQTTTPPQSPVAWSTFITGMDPGGHGIYDFVERRPETLSLFSSMAQTTEGGHRIPLGPYRLPVSSGHVRNLRGGTAFWQILAEHGVPVTVLRMPTNFPPLPYGRAVAGMGTPDLLGTFGTFTFYTDDPRQKTRDVSGGRIVHVTGDRRHRIALRIAGPPNSLRADQAPTSVTMTAYVDPAADAARFDLDGRQLILRQGEWSGWVHTRFALIPGLKSVAGMFRIYVKQLHPVFAVYVSPINIDPEDPALPITAPASYSQDLVRALEPFYTQGMAQDTAALRQGVLTRAEYLIQSREVSEEMLGLLRYGVEHFTGGLLFFHFFGVDQNSHMLWGDYDGELLDTYRLVDQTVGWVRRKLPRATLIVMSDHGFSTFKRAVHLNSWLREEGLLALKGSAASGGEGFENVDWQRTKAYAAGLNGMYINQEGRESEGTVSAGTQTSELVDEIRRRLLRFRDPKGGAPVVHSVAVPERDFHGGLLDSAPDLIVGYYPGYRSSWQTALGATPKAVIEDNTDEWRADHCIDPIFVPGTLLSTRKSKIESPHLYDLTVTALREFGIEPPDGMIGQSIF